MTDPGESMVGLLGHLTVTIALWCHPVLTGFPNGMLLREKSRSTQFILLKLTTQWLLLIIFTEYPLCAAITNVHFRVFSLPPRETLSPCVLVFPPLHQPQAATGVPSADLSARVVRGITCTSPLVSASLSSAQCFRGSAGLGHRSECHSFLRLRKPV